MDYKLLMENAAMALCVTTVLMCHQVDLACVLLI